MEPVREGAHRPQLGFGAPLIQHDLGHVEAVGLALRPGFETGDQDVGIGADAPKPPDQPETWRRRKAGLFFPGVGLKACDIRPGGHLLVILRNVGPDHF